MATCKDMVTPCPLFRGFQANCVTREDIDFRRHMTTVKAAYAKNRESRNVPINDVLTTTLRRVRMSLNTVGPVSRSRQGIPYQSLRTAFKYAVHQAEIDDLTFHNLRHTFASLLVRGVSIFPLCKRSWDTRTSV